MDSVAQGTSMPMGSKRGSTSGTRSSWSALCHCKSASMRLWGWGLWQRVNNTPVVIESSQTGSESARTTPDISSRPELTRRDNAVMSACDLDLDAAGDAGKPAEEER